jgi:hypothetical protein
MSIPTTIAKLNDSRSSGINDPLGFAMGRICEPTPQASVFHTVAWLQALRESAYRYGLISPLSAW